MDGKEKELQSLCQSVRAVLFSKRGFTLIEFFRDYKALNFKTLSWKSLGYNDITSLLKTIPNVVRLVYIPSVRRHKIFGVIDKTVYAAEFHNKVTRFPQEALPGNWRNAQVEFDRDYNFYVENTATRPRNSQKLLSRLKVRNSNPSDQLRQKQKQLMQKDNEYDREITKIGDPRMIELSKKSAPNIKGHYNVYIGKRSFMTRENVRKKFSSFGDIAEVNFSNERVFIHFYSKISAVNAAVYIMEDDFNAPISRHSPNKLNSSEEVTICIENIPKVGKNEFKEILSNFGLKCNNCKFGRQKSIDGESTEKRYVDMIIDQKLCKGYIDVINKINIDGQFLTAKLMDSKENCQKSVSDGHHDVINVEDEDPPPPLEDIPICNGHSDYENSNENNFKVFPVKHKSEENVQIIDKKLSGCTNDNNNSMKIGNLNQSPDVIIESSIEEGVESLDQTDNMINEGFSNLNLSHDSDRSNCSNSTEELSSNSSTIIDDSLFKGVKGVYLKRIHSGFGFNVASYSNGLGCIIVDIRGGSPADVAGLAVDDILLQINGIICTKIPYSDILNFIIDKETLELLVKPAKLLRNSKSSNADRLMPNYNGRYVLFIRIFDSHIKPEDMRAFVGPEFFSGFRKKVHLEDRGIFEASISFDNKTDAMNLLARNGSLLNDKPVQIAPYLNKEAKNERFYEANPWEDLAFLITLLADNFEDSLYKPRDLPDTCEITITTVINSQLCWGWIMDEDNINDFQSLLEMFSMADENDIFDYNGDSERAVVFSNDEWYRCLVLNPYDDEKYQVFFVDYGNTEIVPVSALRCVGDVFWEIAHLSSPFCVIDENKWDMHSLEENVISATVLKNSRYLDKLIIRISINEVSSYDEISS